MTKYADSKVEAFSHINVRRIDIEALANATNGVVTARDTKIEDGFIITVEDGYNWAQFTYQPGNKNYGRANRMASIVCGTVEFAATIRPVGREMFRFATSGAIDEVAKVWG